MLRQNQNKAGSWGGRVHRAADRSLGSPPLSLPLEQCSPITPGGPQFQHIWGCGDPHRTPGLLIAPASPNCFWGFLTHIPAGTFQISRLPP